MRSHGTTHPWSNTVSQKIVGNFVVGTAYCTNNAGQWSGLYLLRRYGVNNGRIIALKSLPDLFPNCEQAAERAMQLGEEFAKGLDQAIVDMPVPGSGDELFIPPSASAQRAEALSTAG